MAEHSMKIIRCPHCGSENPDISVCLECGKKITIAPPISHKEFVKRPTAITLFTIFLLVNFARNSFSAIEADNFLPKFIFLGLAGMSIYLAYGLWNLKMWARKFMIYYCGLIIFLSWIIILLLLFFVPDDWMMSFAELSRSNLGGYTFINAIGHKALFVKAIIATVIYSLLIMYFYKPDIRYLFED